MEREDVTDAQKEATAALTQQLGQRSSMMWQMTTDAFIKFQLKQKMLGKDGTAVFIKTQASNLKKSTGKIEDKVRHFQSVEILEGYISIS